MECMCFEKSDISNFLMLQNTNNKHIGGTSTCGHYTIQGVGRMQEAMEALWISCRGIPGKSCCEKRRGKRREKRRGKCRGKRGEKRGEKRRGNFS